MFEASQNFYVEILIPKVMVLGGGVFGRWIGNELKVLMNGNGALIKEGQERSLTPCAI